MCILGIMFSVQPMKLRHFEYRAIVLLKLHIVHWYLGLRVDKFSQRILFVFFQECVCF